MACDSAFRVMGRGGPAGGRAANKRSPRGAWIGGSGERNDRLMYFHKVYTV